MKKRKRPIDNLCRVTGVYEIYIAAFKKVYRFRFEHLNVSTYFQEYEITYLHLMVRFMIFPILRIICLILDFERFYEMKKMECFLYETALETYTDIKQFLNLFHL